MNKDETTSLGGMGIAEATERFGLTPRALRFYEEAGLIHAHRDARNGRCFDEVALGRIQWIAWLRRANVSLSEIQEILSVVEEKGRRRDVALGKLEARRQAVIAELAAIETAASAIATGRAALRPGGAVFAAAGGDPHDAADGPARWRHG